MEFRTLGPLQVVDAGRALALGSALQRAVLGLLLVDAPESVSVDRLIDELWGERPPASAQHAVQVYVSAIRKLLRASGEVSVRTVGSAYALEISADRVDARRFERLLGDAQRLTAEDPSRAGELFDEALGLWRGAPLAELAQFEFARREANRLEELHTSAIEGLVDARLACGEHAEVLGMIGALVASNPLRERPRRLLMLALYRNGRHAEALEAYRDACAALDEIGLQPGPELRQLEQAVLQHAPTLAAPGRAAGDQGNLPIAANALVGRTAELAAACALLERSDVRLVTLVGPGGAGKTRLSLAVAAKAAAAYADGVWFVALAPISDPELVVGEIARVLGVSEAADQPLLSTLVAGLAHRRLLVVIDNFEHLIRAAERVGELLAGAPGLDLVVTSREALRIRGEHRLEVPPLPGDDAAELFLQRARAVRSDAATGAGDSEVVEQICSRLDGIPLALELAAAHVSLFSVGALEGRLADRLELPGSPRDVPARQRTLRATIDWSYQMLPDAERALFRHLAPFVGGARLETIEATFAYEGANPLETVGALVDKSLLWRRDDPDAQPRFWMLDTIRDYAATAPDTDGAGEDPALRHAQYFLELAEDAERRMRTREGPSQLQRVKVDHDNLRAAFDFHLARDPPSALRMAAALGVYWESHLPISEAQDRLDRVMVSAPMTGMAAARASLFAGRLLLTRGDYTEAENLLTQALELARDASDTRTQVLALTSLEWVASANSQLQLAIDLDEQAVAIARDTDDEWALCHALNGLGALLYVIEQPERARPLLEQALAISRRLGLRMQESVIAANLAELVLDSGDLDTADVLIAECVTAARELEHHKTLCGGLALEALLALHRGELDAALTSERASLDSLRVHYDVMAATMLLAAAAPLAAARGNPLRAATLWAALDRELPRLGMSDFAGARRLRETWLPHARDSVDPAAWEAAWTAGAALRPEQAFNIALDH